ncbi:hypothetical protein RN053_20900 [Pantoea dispersa]|uniref:hypothetical protein n=1 Tax=Pantoea dispersa TaxID=59814 RepID=UPI0028DEADAB|nr:hypothetical protein [Pantoea dispersa]MDT8852971.1 hypothetical protein [Pantoea dispersa]
MSDEQRIESFEARIQQLQKDLAEQKRKNLTHEIMSGILLTQIIRVVDKISPNQNAAQVLLDALKEAQPNVENGPGGHDPQVTDAMSNAIKLVTRATK